MKCVNCGKTIPEVSTSCPYCNTLVDENAPKVNFGSVDDIGYDDKFDLKVYIKEPKNKKVVIGAIGIIVVVILVFVLLISSMFSSNEGPDYKLYTDLVNSFSEYLDDNFINSESPLSGSYDLKLKINDKSSRFKGKYGYDLKNKLMSITGVMEDPRQGDKEVVLETKDFDFDIYMDLNNIYFSSNQIYDKPILLPIDDEVGLLKTKKYDLETLMNSIEDSLIETLKIMSYSTTIEKINYLGVEKSLNKKSIIFDDAGKKRFFMKFYDTLREDSNFTNEYAKVIGKKSDDVVKILENYSRTAEYKYNGSNKEKTILSIYYDSSKTYKVVFDSSEENNKIYEFTFGENKYYLDCNDKDKNIFSITLALNIKELQDSITKTYEITYEDDSYSIEVDLKLSLNEDYKVKRREIENYKNINDFDYNEINQVKTNLAEYISDNTLLEKIQSTFKDKCYLPLECACDDEAYCTCQYNDELIKCPKSIIDKNKN